LNKTYSYFGRSLQTTVILHTDHCAKKLLPWIDGLLDASEKHFAETGKSLFSSHMIDLSEEQLKRISKFVKPI
jgi:fructose/tagatose bisphosphate aldolase